MLKKVTTYFTKQDLIVLSGLVFIFIILFSLCFVSEGSQGGADSFVHYRISRFAFKYPHLFFDHWGKPLFVILSAPFAQFGFTGIRTFNILVGIFSAWFIYKSAIQLKLKAAWAAMILAFASPLYTSILLSGLTEPLFGLVAIIAVYLALVERYEWSAVVISLIPFARTEGFIFFPLFTLIFILRKRWKAIPLLLTGFLLFSVAGYPVFGDWLWVINNMPYTGAKDLYGSGSFWHFFQYSELIFGLPLLILGSLGILTAIFKWLNNYEKKENFIVLNLIPGIVLSYFLAHSVVWYLGAGGSLGLTRIITGIMPVMALSALLALQPFFNSIKTDIVGYVLTAGFCIWAVILPFTTDKFPVKLGGEEIVLKAATDYIEEEKLNTGFIVYYNPIVSFFMDLDPWDKSASKEQVFDSEQPEKNLPKGTLVIWDAHFGPNEGRLPLETLKNSPYFDHIQSFDPQYPFNVYGGHPYQVNIFRRK